MTMNVGAVRPIFVVGSPRSGTTMLGAWLASDPRSYDVGEYRAFHLAYRVAPEIMPGFQPPSWAPHLERYLAEVQDHAAAFIATVARAEGCDSYVDSSPRNLAIADRLAARFPDALFVLMLRHYSGVVQSLDRTAWPWVPDGAVERARVWAHAYSDIDKLPQERTVAVSYDHLCAAPEGALAAASSHLKEHGLRVGELHRRALSRSYAHLVDQARPTLVDEEGRFRPIPSVDMVAWTPAVHASVFPVVEEVEKRLRAAFPEYRGPEGWTARSGASEALPGRARRAREPGAGVERLVLHRVIPELRSIEYTVADLEPCLELLVSLMRLELVGRFHHPDLDAEVAQVRSGSMTINLLCPTDTGQGRAMPQPDPRLSQLTLVVRSAEEVATIRRRLVEGGAAVIERDERMFLLDAHMIKGLFGTDSAIVVSSDEEATDVDSGG